MRNKKVLWMAQTAIFIALLIVVQYFTKGFSQYVTGSLVNLLLVASALIVGLGSGITIAVISPFLAFLIGIGPAFIQLVPVVALGNAVIVLVAWLIAPREGKAGVVRRVLAVIAGAAAKFAVLWLGVVKLVLPLISTASPAQVQKMSAMFTWPQLFTALIGAGVAMIAVPLIQKALKKSR